MEADPIKICRLSRTLLRFTCLWPLKGEDFQKGLISKLLIVVPGTLSVIIVYFGILHIQVLYKGIVFFIYTFFLYFFIEGYNLGEDLSFLMSAIDILILFCIYNYYQKDIASLLVDLSNFEEFRKPKGFDELNKRHDFYVKCVAVYFTFSMIDQKLFVLKMMPICEARNINENCGLISNTTPKPLTSLSYVLYSIFETMIFSIFAKTSLVVSYHLFEISTHLVLRIEDLKQMIVESVNTKNYNISKKKLKHCIKYHILIIE